MILKPGTGTNPYYARKYGNEIPNTLDKVLAGLCPAYEPTGATNSIDAAEMLWKGERVEFASNSRTPAPTVAQKACDISYSNETYGVRSAPTYCPAPSPTLKPPVDLTDPAGVLKPGQGWSEEDCQRQRQALAHCPGTSTSEVIGSAFSQSHHLDNKSFAKTGWGAALFTGSMVAGMGALFTAWTNPGLAAGLATGALAGAAGSAALLKSSGIDANNAHILSDLGRRLDAKTWGQNYDRHGSHGNYQADFKA